MENSGMTVPPTNEPNSNSPVQRWYLPTWGERLALMKWRLLYFVPLLVMLTLLVFIPFVVLYLWKLLVIAVVVPLTAAANTAKNAIRLRKEPFCIHCGYDLTGLPDGHLCPECGIRFSWAEIDD